MLSRVRPRDVFLHWKQISSYSVIQNKKEEKKQLGIQINVLGWVFFFSPHLERLLLVCFLLRVTHNTVQCSLLTSSATD